MKLIIDIDENDYELLNKTSITLDMHTVFHGKDKDKEMTFAIFDLVKALKNGIPYEERPQGELTSRSALIKWIDDSISQYGHTYSTDMLNMWGLFKDYLINNAPTVSDRYNEGYAQGYIDGSTGADMRGEEE